MATTETKAVDNIIASRRAMLLGGGAVLAALATSTTAKAASTVTTYTDTDILNFALNLEYLEGNFYYLAAFGTTIDVPNTASTNAGAPKLLLNGTGTQGGTVLYKPSPQVPFDPKNFTVSSYAIETAIEEGKHVAFLRDQLGTAAVAQPQIDLLGAWNTLAAAAGIGPAFDPFASEANFLIGAYVFEDVGVTAYHGAAPLLTSKTILGAAVGIHAVEAYHAGLVRTTLNFLDPDGSKGLIALTQQISALRTKLSQAASTASPTVVDDVALSSTVAPNMVMLNGVSSTATSIVDADPAFVRGFSRTTTQVLNIVTGGGATTAGAKATGVFFPAGLNGLFS